MKKTTFFMLIAFLSITSLLFTSCSGGGGGAASTSTETANGGNTNSAPDGGGTNGGGANGAPNGGGTNGGGANGAPGNPNNVSLEGTWFCTNQGGGTENLVFAGSNVTYNILSDSSNWIEATGTFTKPSPNNIKFDITVITGQISGESIDQTNIDTMKEQLNRETGFDFTITNSNAGLFLELEFGIYRKIQQ